MEIVDEFAFHQMMKDVMLEDCDFDNEGQLVFHTGVYKHRDGSFHDEADPYFTRE
jgi:hypothetical protein